MQTVILNKLKRSILMDMSVNLKGKLMRRGIRMELGLPMEGIKFMKDFSKMGN